ncbi:Uncharacterised protein [Salmonella enterica]|nr:Uncharacterised protein [Salmonella enterica]
MAALSPSFVSLLRWCGQLDYIRRHWAERYSDKTLLLLVDVLEPLATPLLRRLMAEHRLFAPQESASTERTTVVMLWQFTFAFLIVESNRAFTPHRFLRYLIQRLATWRNITFTDQLAALQGNVMNIGDRSLADSTLSRLLEIFISDKLLRKSTQCTETSPSRYQLALSPR